jgi:hypothetical protein
MHWIDPVCLPETFGVVDCFLLNAEGEADGFVLTDATEVHFPPHMGGAVLDAIKAGSAVRIRGVRPRGVAMIAAVAVAPEEGTLIVDGGPPEDSAARKAARKQALITRTAMEVEGVLRQVLHGPKGDVRGLLLEDGRVGRFPPHAARGSRPTMAPLSPSARSAQHPMISGGSKPRRGRKKQPNTNVARRTSTGSATGIMRQPAGSLNERTPGRRWRKLLPATSPRWMMMHGNDIIPSWLHIVRAQTASAGQRRPSTPTQRQRQLRHG